MPAHKYTLEQRINQFWSKVNKDCSVPAHMPQLGSCWEWTKSCCRDGYGHFYLNSRLQGTHRVSWQIAFGEIPQNMMVLHKCDNRKCVNPSHLFLGTHMDNTIDKLSKGREAKVKGEKNGCHKLTWIQVDEIRKQYKKGHISQRQLAEIYGVVQTTIGGVLRGKYWKQDKA